MRIDTQLNSPEGKFKKVNKMKENSNKKYFKKPHYFGGWEAFI
jgi:hypothetical protein